MTSKDEMKRIIDFSLAKKKYDRKLSRDDINALFLGLAKIVRKNAIEEVSGDIKRECEEAKQNFAMTLKDLSKAESMVKKLSSENAKLLSRVEILHRQICQMVSRSNISIQ